MAEAVERPWAHEAAVVVVAVVESEGRKGGAEVVQPAAEQEAMPAAQGEDAGRAREPGSEEPEGHIRGRG